MNLDFPGRRAAIEAALLEYHRFPGKYSPLARQPALLFSSVTEVLQLAGGHSPDGASGQPPSEPVRQAACLFIRSALLHPRSDHYALLGLSRSADSAAIKDRYRLFMRLIHPDFSGTAGSASWPADAATRVNMAHEVLLSQTQRRLYDEGLDESPGLTQQSGTGQSPSAPRKAARSQRMTLKALAMVFGGLGVVAVAAFLLASGSSRKEELVQRPVPKEMKVSDATAPKVSLEASERDTDADSPTVSVVSAGDSARAVEAAQASDATIDPGPRAEQSHSRIEVRPGSPKPPPAIATQPAATAIATGPTTTAMSSLTPVARADEKAPRLPASQALSSVSAPTPDPAHKSISIASTASQNTVTQATSPETTRMPEPALSNTRKSTAPTLEEAHPLLSTMLQKMESGWGSQVISLLDRQARATPAAQVFRLQFNSLVGWHSPVKVSRVQFTGQQLEDRLLVTGYVTLEIGDITMAATGKDFSIQAEFARREGAVVMTKLSAGPSLVGGAK